jgi:pimeloyl-ACP methyl ester carboxylesterase
MTPLFFGTSRQPLFGLYRPPRERDLGQGVLLCPPLGQDYMRSHRALRQLAVQLAKAGLHVLRFDYRGVGDSWGDPTDATLAAWRDDTCTAIDELKDTAGVKAVSLVGLRIGASVAHLAQQGRSDIEHLVLWDPVVSGPDYLRELQALADTPGATAPDAVLGAAGFGLGPTFRQELAALDMAASPVSGARRTYLVVSEPRAEYQRLQAHLQRQGQPFACDEINAGASWDNAEQMGAVLLPQAIIRAIAARISPP